MQKQRRQKDWICPDCGDDVFGWRKECNQCGKWRPLEKRDGDWDCSCGKSNFGSRSECFQCGEKRKRTNKQDWVCPNCDDYQFSKNKKCRKCGTDRPAFKECIVCCDETNQGLECRSFHFTCGECLSGDIQANGEKRIDKDGIVSCLSPECEDCYDPNEVSKHVDVKLIMKVVNIHKEREMASEMEERYRGRMNGDIDGLIAQRHYDHITNGVLSLSCPRCSMVYTDFTGCCALKCHSSGCGFCAWCLEDCGSDAHSHVARCSAKPVGADTFFANESKINSAMVSLRTKKFIHYWKNLDEISKNMLKNRIEPILTDDIVHRHEIMI